MPELLALVGALRDAARTGDLLVCQAIEAADGHTVGELGNLELITVMAEAQTWLDRSANRLAFVAAACLHATIACHGGTRSVEAVEAGQTAAICPCSACTLARHSIEREARAIIEKAVPR